MKFLRTASPVTGGMAVLVNAAETVTIGLPRMYGYIILALLGIESLAADPGALLKSVSDALPVVWHLDNATISEEVTSRIDFDVEANNTSLNGLTLVGRSLNQTVIPDSGILFAGTGRRRSLILSPNQPGNVDIAVVLTAGRTSATNTFTITVTPRAAQSPAMLLSAVASEYPRPHIKLVFPTDASATEYRIYRKTVEALLWGEPLARLPGTATAYVDNSVALGSAFEYRVVKNQSYAAYLRAGIRVPMMENRGTVILLVDDTVSLDLQMELSRLERDLVGDGWKVVRHEVSRADSPVHLKQIIQQDYGADPVQVKSVFLFGHVPIPYSGWYSPDGHHERAFPADVFYGDMVGTWTDDLTGTTPPVRPETRNYPNDGTFDQSNIPADIALQIGRVDLFNLPAFLPRSEKDLLRQYLNKDHQFRNGLLNVERRGLVDGLWTTASLPNQAAMFGPSKVACLPMLPTLASHSYLWGSRGQGGSYWGQVDAGASTADFAASDPQVVFLEMAGSYFGEWDIWNDFLRAPLGSPNYVLTSSWFMPAWRYHPMALGETAGYAANITQNNPSEGGIYSLGAYDIGGVNTRRVHIALMGDPTLRLHAVAPPTELVPWIQSNRVRLEWKESPDAVEGYAVYRSVDPHGPFSRISPALIKDGFFNNTNAPVGNLTYMVRAVKLEVSGSGTYFNPSVGVTRTIPAKRAAPSTVPSVRVTSPTQGSMVYNPVRIAASATGDGGVAKVEFSVDRAVIRTVTEEPYSFHWDTATWPAGDHDVSAKAFDCNGHFTASTVRVSLNKTDAIPPTLRVLEPSAGQRVWGNVIIRCSADDNAAVDRVQLRADGTLVSTVKIPPYDFLWKTYDSRTGKQTVPDGLHRVQVTAYDRSGNASNQTVNVAVDSALSHPTILRNSPTPLTSQPGLVLDLAYHWQGGPATREWLVFTHLVNQAGASIAVDTHSPPVPALFWSGNYSYSVKFRINRLLPPGTYKIMTGLFLGTERLALNAGPDVVPDEQWRYQTGTLNIQPDTTPPQIHYCSLRAGQRVSGDVNIALRAADNTQVDHVELYVDGHQTARIHVSCNVPEVGNSPTENIFYTGSYGWDTTLLSNGLHRLNLRATDASGNPGDFVLDLQVSNPMIYVLSPPEITAKAGGAVDIAYRWSGGPTTYPVQVMTEFVNESSKKIGIRTLHTPMPSSETWSGGEVIYSQRVEIPANIAPGKYKILVRMIAAGGGAIGFPVGLAPGPGVSRLGTSVLTHYHIGALLVAPH